MKLNYKPTYEFTSVDIEDYNADPPITFEAKGLRDTDWVAASKPITSDIDGFTVASACAMVGAGLTAVQQNGERYPIDGVKQAKELHQAVSEQSKDAGDTFIKHLALGIIIMLQRRDEERKKKLTPSEPE